MEKKINILIILTLVVLLFVILNYIVTLNGFDIVTYSASEAYSGRKVLENSPKTTYLPNPNVNLRLEDQLADYVCTIRSSVSGGCSGKSTSDQCKVASDIRNKFLDGNQICCGTLTVTNLDGTTSTFQNRSIPCSSSPAPAGISSPVPNQYPY